MHRPPRSLTAFCSSALSAVYFASSSVNTFLALTSSGSLLTTKLVAKEICSGVKPILTISCLASNSGLPPSRISVPLPAMFVAIVTAPILPASATICASLSCCFAFRTLCLMPLFFRRALNNSDVSMEIVPTNTG